MNHHSMNLVYLRASHILPSVFLWSRFLCSPPLGDSADRCVASVSLSAGGSLSARWV